MAAFLVMTKASIIWNEFYIKQVIIPRGEKFFYFSGLMNYMWDGEASVSFQLVFTEDLSIVYLYIFMWL